MSPRPSSPASGLWRAGRRNPGRRCRQGLELLLVPLSPGKIGLLFLLNQDPRGDVMMDHDRIRGTIVLQSGHPKLEPSLLIGGVARILQDKGAVASQDRPDAGRSRFRAGSIASRRTREHLKVVDADLRAVTGLIGVTEVLPRPIGGDNRSRLVKNRDWAVTASRTR